MLVSIFATIGRTAVLHIDAATNQAIAGLTPKDAQILNSSYLKYLLDASVNVLTSEARGVAQVNINGAILKALPIPTPPMSEQERIVKLLDQADALRKLRVKSDQRTAQLIPALFHDMFGDPATNPMGWSQVKLGIVTETIRGLTFKPADVVNEYTENSIVCFRTKNIQSTLMLDDMIRIPKSLVRNNRQFVQVGDCLVSTANSSNLVGKCCIVPKLNFPATLGGFIAGLRPCGNSISAEYLYSWLSSRPIQALLRRLARKTTNIANLPLKDIENLTLPLPPLTQQQEFAERVAEIHDMEMQQTTNYRRLEELFQSTLQRAFAGEF